VKREPYDGWKDIDLEYLDLVDCIWNRGKNSEVVNPKRK
jgi:hypothetical protein